MLLDGLSVSVAAVWPTLHSAILQESKHEFEMWSLSKNWLSHKVISGINTSQYWCKCIQFVHTLKIILQFHNCIWWSKMQILVTIKAVDNAHVDSFGVSLWAFCQSAPAMERALAFLPNYTHVQSKWNAWSLSSDVPVSDAVVNECVWERISI